MVIPMYFGGLEAKLARQLYSFKLKILAKAS